MTSEPFQRVSPYACLSLERVLGSSVQTSHKSFGHRQQQPRLSFTHPPPLHSGTDHRDLASSALPPPPSPRYHCAVRTRLPGSLDTKQCPPPSNCSPWARPRRPRRRRRTRRLHDVRSHSATRAPDRWAGDTAKQRTWPRRPRGLSRARWTLRACLAWLLLDGEYGTRRRTGCAIRHCRCAA